MTPLPVPTPYPVNAQAQRNEGGARQWRRDMPSVTCPSVGALRDTALASPRFAFLAFRAFRACQSLAPHRHLITILFEKLFDVEDRHRCSRRLSPPSSPSTPPGRTRAAAVRRA